MSRRRPSPSFPWGRLGLRISAFPVIGEGPSPTSGKNRKVAPAICPDGVALSGERRAQSGRRRGMFRFEHLEIWKREGDVAMPLFDLADELEEKTLPLRRTIAGRCAVHA